MFVYGNIKLFFVKFIVGLLSIVISGLVFFAFWKNINSLDSFKIVPLELYYNSLFLYYFSYFANFILIFFGISAFLIPFFLLIQGIRILLGIRTYYLVLKFLLLILSILLLNIIISLSNLLGQGIVGGVILSFLLDKS